jgi:hypothetical protein
VTLPMYPAPPVTSTAIIPPSGARVFPRTG